MAIATARCLSTATSDILPTPREVRHALAYVLNNARRHRVVGTLEAFLAEIGASFDVGARISHAAIELARPVAGNPPLPVAERHDRLRPLDQAARVQGCRRGAPRRN
ncbi:MAG: hypothetical protein H6837_13635 [Planctomycetes bacterium]|nr:hypothetical protein [Planctomycetota bacterium]